MKIAILHTDYRIYWSPRLKALHDFLLAKGHTLIVLEIAGKGSEYSFAEHMEVSDFPSWLVLFPDQRIECLSPREVKKAVTKALDNINPDVLLSGGIAFYSGSAAFKWAGDRNKPLVIFDKARLQDVKRNFFINYMKKKLYCLADAISCPAPSHALSFKYLGFQNESIFYGLNCIDNSFFKEQLDSSKNTGIEIKLPNRYFLTIGRQIKKKNLRLLILAFKQYLIKTKDKAISLVLVGNGEENIILRLLAGDLIDKFIYFVPFLQQEQLISIYKGATAYVLPSLYGETWGLSVNEAMACNKPVVVSNQCGCYETLVRNEENGWTFEPTNQEELENIFLEIGSIDQTTLSEMGVCSEKIISDWGIEGFTEKIWQSINYAIIRSKKVNKRYLFLSRILSHLWNGRYRPEIPVKQNEVVLLKHLVILHTDLRLYWRSRLNDLQKMFNKIGIVLDIIEIAGKGSPYVFEEKGKTNDNLNWHILFPEKAAEEISPFESQKAIRHKLRELNPDIVMAGALAFQSGTGALKWKSKTGKPVIIFDDARPEDVKRNWLVNNIKKKFYRNVDALICPAPSHEIGFTKWGLKREEIFYGIDVVDNKLFERNKSGSCEHSKLKIICQPYLLAIGRQIEIKNWGNLLKAFIQFKKDNTRSTLNLVFIGEGPLHRSLVELVELEQRKDVIFRPFIQQSSIVQYYHKARGLILPSYRETWGLVINEAMAAGLPVLVSRECGCSQTLIREGINGWTFDPNNLLAIAKAISKLDQLSQNKWAEMSQSSVEIIKEWDLPRFSQGVLDALTYVSGKHKIKSTISGRLLLNFWHGRYRPL